ncbi:MAG TPA: KTSC domain-containing protein [Bryobacteraceae bacterium]|nr:KTSC domain-containing protein [Bryobacteraceae bacterium]
MFLSVAYDGNKRVLYLGFRSGDVYRYFQFSRDDYQHFLSAESKGRHFLRDTSPYAYPAMPARMTRDRPIHPCLAVPRLN